MNGPTSWFGLVVENAAGTRRWYRHLDPTIWPTDGDRQRVVDVALMHAGPGAGVVRLARCTQLDHLCGPRHCRFEEWQR